jgi:hypothetical protein
LRATLQYKTRVSIKGFWQKPQWLFPSCHFFFLCQVVALALPTEEEEITSFQPNQAD